MIMTKTVSVDTLTPLCHLLLRFHDAIDKIYCFILKRKMIAKVSRIETLYNNLQCDDNFEIDFLHKLCIISPHTHSLREFIGDGLTGVLNYQHTDIELVYNSSYDSGSKAHINKRRKLLIENMAQKDGSMTSSSNEANLKKLCEGYKLWRTEVLTSKMSHDFKPTETNILLHNPEAHSIECCGGAQGVLNYLKMNPSYQDHIAHVERIPGREAIFAKLSPPTLPIVLERRLEKSLGLQQFYLHQALAIDALRSGKHAVVSTSTASGKSVIFNIPVLEAVLLEPQTTALYLFPTKALAQDQLRALLAITGNGTYLPVTCAVCDGDTPQCERARIQFPTETGAPNIILTNPDMLHCTLLPEHRSWRRLFENIRYVVVDEAHQYRGAFGAHVAGVLRRLLRLCLFYGRSPQFLCCSATIANPAEHMLRLIPLHALHGEIGSDGYENYLAVIGANQDGSPQGERLFAIWNPPLRRGMGDLPVEFTTKTSQEGDSCLLLTLPEKQHGTITSHPDSTVHNEENQESHSKATAASGTELSPKKRRFLEACAEARPATMGVSRSLHVLDPQLQYHGPPLLADAHQSSTTIASHTLHLPANPVYEVKYVRGWKRGRHTADSGVPRSVPALQEESESLAHQQKLMKDRNTYDKIPNNTYPGLDQRRMSTIWETSALFSLLMRKRLRTLAFCKTRKLVELVLSYTLRDLETSGVVRPHDSVVSYRGGYTKEQRRKIEAGLFNGRILGVAATCALELGIDVGALDVTLHMGFPGTFSSLWQQAGRAGRSGREALSIITCFDSPIDQYFARNPKMLFNSPVEAAVLDVQNTHVMFSHLLCAASEVPLNYNFEIPSNSSLNTGSLVSDNDIWGDAQYRELLKCLVESGKVHQVHSTGSSSSIRVLHSVDPLDYCAIQWKLTAGAHGATAVSLRMIDPVVIRVLDDSRGGVEIDSLGYSRAFYELYEGAIYMHQAQQYRVISLDIQSAIARTRPVKVRYYTSATNNILVNVMKVQECDGVLSYGTVQITSTVYGYVKRWLGTGEIFEKGDCSLPPLQYETSAFWIDLPVHIKRAVEAQGLCPLASIHAASHAIAAIAPWFAQCDTTDVNTEHINIASALVQPFRIMLYDTHMGGLGASSAVYSCGREVLARARNLVDSCSCGSAAMGCPGCTLSVRCTHNNRDLSRQGAILLLDLLLVHIDHHHSMHPRGFIKVDPVEKFTRLRQSLSSAEPSGAPEGDDGPSRRKQKASVGYHERARRMAIQMNWTETMPGFYQESDSAVKLTPT